MRHIHSELREIVWADPGVLWKKPPRAIRAMGGKTLQTVPFKGISTVLWVHQRLPQSTVSQAFPSNKSYESKAGCNRTPATVLWVPLIVVIFKEKNNVLAKIILGAILACRCEGGRLPTQQSLDFAKFPPTSTSATSPELLSLCSGISKPMVCQTYGLHAGRLSRERQKRRKQLRQLQTRS